MCFAFHYIFDFHFLFVRYLNNWPMYIIFYKLTSCILVFVHQTQTTKFSVFGIFKLKAICQSHSSWLCAQYFGNIGSAFKPKLTNRFRNTDIRLNRLFGTSDSCSVNGSVQSLMNSRRKKKLEIDIFEFVFLIDEDRACMKRERFQGV